MKKFSMLLAGFAMSVCLMVSCTSKSTFTINGVVSDDVADSVFYIYLADENQNIPDEPSDILYVKDKKFTFTANVSEPRFLDIYNSERIINSLILIPGSTMNINVGEYSCHVSGSQFYQECGTFYAFRDDLSERMNDLARTIDSIIEITGDKSMCDSLISQYYEMASEDKPFVHEHKNMEGVLVASALWGGFRVGDFFDSTNMNIRNGRLKAIFDSLEEREKAEDEYNAQLEINRAEVQTGMMFKDFEVNYDGNIRKLSDYVGNGKYVFVDFWASWCGPCVAAMPGLINIYNKHKGDNFEVVGIAVDDKPEAAQRVLNELGVIYPTFIHSTEEAALLYAINGIPYYYLFGPDGTILDQGIVDQSEECMESRIIQFMK